MNVVVVVGVGIVDNNIIIIILIHDIQHHSGGQSPLKIIICNTLLLAECGVFLFLILDISKISKLTIPCLGNRAHC